LLKAKIESLTPAAPRPAIPAPEATAKPPAAAVVARPPAAAPEKVSKSPASEPVKKMVAVVGQVTIQREVENEPPNWEQRVQLRLMELDVDPGNDADRGVSKNN